MPNIPANRLSSQFDLAGPAFTVQAGKASGLVALRIAARALARDELDAALVGAVDLSCEPVHRRAGARTPGDAAIGLVVKRLADAQRDGDRIYASFDFDRSTSSDDAGLMLGDAPDCLDLASRIGVPFAASGLIVHVAAAALCLRQRCGLDGNPRLDDAAKHADVRLADGHRLRLAAPPSQARAVVAPTARLRCFAGVDKAAVISALEAGHENLEGPARRLVLVAEDARFEETRERALAHLRSGTPAGAGVHFRERPIGGQIAFVFAGAGASYHGMGRDLLGHFPQLTGRLASAVRSQAGSRRRCAGGTFEDGTREPGVQEQLWGASALSQLHVEFSRGLLGLEPDAWLGYSSGETNALIASGAWNDADALMADMESSRLVSHELGGEFAAVARVWNRPVRWANWTVLAPIEDVRAAMTDVPRVHVAIVNGEQDVLIAGDEESCGIVVDRIGHNRCLRLVYPLAVHVPELDEVADAWLQLHRRATSTPKGRVYSNAFGRAYAPDTETCAQAILEQADRTLDVRPAVLAAWDDGVRVFVEHGPRGAYGRAIRDALGERDAVIVSLDHKRQGIEATMNAVAALLAAGVQVRHEVFDSAAPAKVSAGRRVQRFEAHPPAIVMPPRRPVSPVVDASWQVMAPAPRLPSMLDDLTAFASTPRAHPAAMPGIAAAPSSEPRRVAASAAAHPVAALFQDQLTRLAQVQQAFAAQHAQVHQRYLSTRDASMQLLLKAASQGKLRSSESVGSAPRIASAVPQPAATTAMTNPDAAQHSSPASLKSIVEANWPGRDRSLSPATVHRSAP